MSQYSPDSHLFVDCLHVDSPNAPDCDVDPLSPFIIAVGIGGCTICIVDTYTRWTCTSSAPTPLPAKA